MLRIAICLGAAAVDCTRGWNASMPWSPDEFAVACDRLRQEQRY
jgi:hypothetical protein